MPIYDVMFCDSEHKYVVEAKDARDARRVFNKLLNFRKRDELADYNTEKR